jgi:hypothetical protein
MCSLSGSRAWFSGWREAEFARVAVADGRTLLGGSLRLRLTGLDLPGPDAACRTLDGRLEPCLVRAASQLELMTRARKLTCRYRLESATDGVGACRIGDSDLAARMLRTGYVKRSAPIAGIAGTAIASAAVDGHQGDRSNPL